MFLATSCRDDTFADFRDDSSDIYNISLTIDLEGMGDRTRAEGKYLDAQIGGGSQIDVIKYAVYYYNTTEQRWEADASYGVANGEEQGVGNVTPGHGQTVLGVEKFPVVINLALKKSETYKIAFWAQNSETEAFVTEDLMKVQMKYKLMDDKGNPTSVNNDERRDAFCRVIDIAPNTNIKGQTVYLRRPLAQINVGTRGYDYETITRNAPKKYLYSKIRINRAARYLNVVEDKIYTTTTEDDSSESTEAFYTIDYEYEKFPAYWNMNAPYYPSYTIYDLKYNTGAYNTFINLHNEEYFKEIPEGSDEEQDQARKEIFRNLYEGEEFLKVKLYAEDNLGDEYSTDTDNDKYRDYVGLGTGTNLKDTRTETFKYLSMCYILTNCEPEEDENGNYKSDVLNNVKMWIATDKNGSDEVEVLNLNNVPVQRNRRTNIVGQLLTAKANVEIKLDNDFAGQKFDGTNALSGEIVDGFYYAGKDEKGQGVFEISNLNGLLFFQELVNGDLKVRQIASGWSGINNITVGSNYPYYDNNHNLQSLSYNSYSKIDLGDRAQLILEGTRFGKSDRITGYTINEDVGTDGWPGMNNFSFYGCVVKLMADIDLKGIEWIPIGFDLATWDSSIGPTNQNYTPANGVFINFAELANATEINFANRRVFAGTFDGNGHTIYNLKTKDFGVDIHRSAFQNSTNSYQSGDTNYSYDNVVWFPKGFFGLVGPGAIIQNLRLQDVDIYGCNGVAGIVGIVNSHGFEVKINKCIVDGGYITGEPLYRGDYRTNNYYRRAIARGVYVAGIVGQFTAYGKDAGVTNCEVRNVKIRGYRRVGGIIGSIADMEGNINSDQNQRITANILVKENTISNSLVLCNQFTMFNAGYNLTGNQDDPNDKNHKIWMNGYGWGSYAQTALSEKVVGGIYNNFKNYSTSKENGMSEVQSTYNNEINSDQFNEISNVQFAELRSTADQTIYEGTARTSQIGNIPLEYFPMLTSWFVDEVTLNYNYYGKPSTYVHRKYADIKIWDDNDLGFKQFSGGITFNAPFANFPSSMDMTFDENSKRAGLYVETIKLNGRGNSNGGRSVITPTGVNEEGACVMYVGARNRHQFADYRLFPVEGHNFTAADQSWLDQIYRQPTTISNVVLRGSPYAWAGIMVSPNENMSVLTLDNVTIYDVYQTIVLDDDPDQGADWYKYVYNINMKGTKNGKADWISLVVKNSNLRGYTVPGADWPSIIYDKTTFEQGAETPFSNEATEKASQDPNANYKTCKVEAPTEFKGCFFKAPFIIDLSNKKGPVTFTNCNATSAYKNVLIDNTKAATASKIIIGTDVQKGETTIKYE